MWTDLKSKCLRYFMGFSTKDVDCISGYFAETAGLRDWENSTNNKEETMKVYEKIFSTEDHISVTPMHMVQEDNVVVCEIMITTGNQSRIFVTDVITFDASNQIVDIRAYRGF